jgi:hypothetical protein
LEQGLHREGAEDTQRNTWRDFAPGLWVIDLKTAGAWFCARRFLLV